jgi:hypothetical protein
MKTYAYHPGGVVAEIIKLDDRLVPGTDIFTRTFAKDLTDVSSVSPLPSQGWTTADAGMSFIEPSPPPVYVPESCSKLGLKRALAETGASAVFPSPEWPTVSKAIAADPEMADDWALATSIRRDDPIVEKMIAARGYDPETVDKILIRANALAG